MGLSVSRGWQGGAVQWSNHRDVDISSSDHTCKKRCVGIYVGVSGDVVAQDQGGTEVTYTDVPVGILQGRFSQITKTSTTALNMIELIYSGAPSL